MIRGPSFLRGHKDSVNCLCFNQYTSLLASASDDCTVRLWDLERSGHKAIRCLLTGSSALNVSFDNLEPHTVWTCNVNNEMMSFDLRNTGTILRQTQLVCHPGTEDVSHLTPIGSKLVVACDDGSVSVFENDQGRWSVCVERTLHSNICSVVTGMDNGDVIVSGGLDAKIVLWDWRESGDVLKELYLEADGCYNPPFVYSIDVSKDEALIAGVGDGRVRVYLLDQQNEESEDLEDIHFDLKLHSSAVSNVHFAGWCEAERGFGDFISVGNDKVVGIWNIEYGFSDQNEEEDDSNRFLKFGFKHTKEKPNWSCSTISRICIADTSADISMYTVL